MDPDLDGMMERAKRRLLARGEMPFNPEYFPPGELFGRVVREGISRHAPTEFEPKRPAYAKKHKRPGRKRGRKF